jgi:hypothetical protein
MTAVIESVERRYRFQGSRLSLVSADAALAAAVDFRLRDYGAPPDSEQDLRIEFLLPPDPDPLRSSADEERRPVYDTPAGLVSYCPAGDGLVAAFGAVHLRAWLGQGLARIWSRGYEAEARYLAAHPLTMIVLCELLKRRGRYSLHAGCVASGEQGALIAGPSGTGKSTLVLALAQMGLDFLSDDMVFLDGLEGQIDVHGFSDAIGVTSDTAARFEELSDLAGGSPPAGFRKHLIRIEDRFAVHCLPVCRPQWLIFPELAPGEVSRLEPMEPPEAWMRLVPDVLLTDPAATGAHLATIAALTKQVTCYRLRSGPDVRRSAELIAALLR